MREYGTVLELTSGYNHELRAFRRTRRSYTNQVPFRGKLSQLPARRSTLRTNKRTTHACMHRVGSEVNSGISSRCPGRGSRDLPLHIPAQDLPPTSGSVPGSIGIRPTRTGHLYRGWTNYMYIYEVNTVAIRPLRIMEFSICLFRICVSRTYADSPLAAP